jgi:hypothetical protein
MDKIINDINARIEDAVRCLIGDVPVSPFGLAKPVNIQDETEMSIPAIIANDGECFYVFTDDDQGLGWYHRLISRNYSQRKGFGDSDLDIQTDELLLVVWGLSNMLGMQAEQVESKIIIPSIPQKAGLVASNFDAKSILSGEFRNFNYLNKPEEFVFSVKYRVSTTFKRKCREIKCD